MKRTHLLSTFIALPLFLACSGCVELEQLAKQVPQGQWQPTSRAALDERTVADGLKEALRVGSQRTVNVTGKVDGFLKNELIRIALPSNIASAAPTLRRLGFGSQVDQLEVAMNRAAERAATEARDIFWEAIRHMTLRDAYHVLNGGNTAATQYLRGQTETQLRGRFRPIVQRKMREVNLYRVYNQALAAYRQIPFAKREPEELDQYITRKALDGLFTVLSQEERRIREQPAARTTELLRKVFG